MVRQLVAANLDLVIKRSEAYGVIVQLGSVLNDMETLFYYITQLEEELEWFDFVQFCNTPCWRFR